MSSNTDTRNLNTNEEQLGWASNTRRIDGPKPVLTFLALSIITFLIFIKEYVKLKKCQRHSNIEDDCGDGFVKFWVVLTAFFTIMLIHQIRVNWNRDRVSNAPLQEGYYDEEDGEQVIG